jgi:hypothetical protein
LFTFSHPSSNKGNEGFSSPWGNKYWLVLGISARVDINSLLVPPSLPPFFFPIKNKNWKNSEISRKEKEKEIEML